MSAVPLVAASALAAGCSSDSPAKAPHTAAPAPAKKAAEEAPAPSPSAPKALALKIGESGEYVTGQMSDDGDRIVTTTHMRVTAVSAKYVTPAEIDTTNKPEKGQYVVLTLTVTNVGTTPAEFSAYGMMQWEDAKTAAQDCTTLEGVGDGPDLDTTYKPGQSATGKLVLDVGHKDGVVSYNDNNSPADGPAFTVALPSA
ncbi:DUF4352 domain-containing protein [Streptomyces sp. NBC_01267]|uniref:DUF4352 domain-containing protein n=1 Tax=Streptomyces sp. NBC_01267 TaxID=2903805 RepID=UPI002E363DB7|nr:DUF4352 domain-containing protein [Streptomyces sp. NBC_01267]